MGLPVLTIKQGTLKGVETKDFDGNPYYKFLGIPYAKPPVGKLRFKAPEPPEPWAGIRDATKEGNICYGAQMFGALKDEMSEDCLFLNVYTRQLPGSKATLKPVMVHLHGGGFTMMSGNEEAHGNADFLMTGDVVYVSFNYRLGIFGFLSLDDPSMEIPGNAGLKDQRMALKWVQENISYFGGDKNNVTIFGISAGGASVHFHILSKSSQGLFHKAISQSGTVVKATLWGCKQSTIFWAETLGKKVTSEQEGLDVLMKADGKRLSEVWLNLPDSFIPSKKRPLCPVIEKPNPTEFITTDPIDIMSSGSYNKVPLIIGFCSNEGLLFEMLKPGTLDSLDDLDKLIPWYLHLKPGTVEFKDLIKKQDQVYFKHGKTPKAICNLLSDVHFISGIRESIKLMHKNIKNPIYVYIYDANTELTREYVKKVSGNKLCDEYINDGAFHGTDYLHLLRRPFKLGQDDVKIMRNMVALWTSFAKDGIPKSSIQWEPVKNPNDVNLLRIDTELSIISDPYPERAEFWDSTFEKNRPCIK